jgi:mannose-6-phosphate isomerase-like protein (cupin superfamily)
VSERGFSKGKKELPVPRIIKEPKRVPAHGTPPKVIEEFIGRAESDGAVSIARMVSPAGWGEPGQTPEFDEYTVVLRGMLQVETREGAHTVRGGQAILVSRGEWVRYSTPEAGGAEYIAVCLPGFSPEIVHRDDEHTAAADQPRE